MNKKGFTLIELLVVISIISLLSTVVLGSLSTARSKARDAKRLQQLKALQTVFELYRHDRGYYPSTSATADVAWFSVANWTSNLTTQLVNNNYISSIPLDPLGRVDCVGAADCTYAYYRYVSPLPSLTCGGRAISDYHYVIMFTLENANSNVQVPTGNTNFNACIAGPVK